MGKIYFISDCHLGAGTLENPLEYERRVVRFLESIEDDCEELFLMGDIIDYWFEFKYVVPRGFTRFLGKLAMMADKGVKIHWFTGNHDIWIFDYLPNIGSPAITTFGSSTIFPMKSAVHCIRAPRS